MAGDRDERTEQATAARRRRARREGRVAQSQDLIAAVVLLVSLGCLRAWGGGALKSCCHQMRAGLLDAFTTESLTPHGVQELAAAGGRVALGCLLPLAIIISLVTLGCGLLQTGFLLRPHAVLPRGSRVSLVRGTRRLLSLRSAVKAAFAAMKFVVIGLGVYWGLVPLLSPDANLYLPALLEGGLLDAVSSAAAHLSTVGLSIAGGFLALSVVDWTYQRWQLERDLRMSRQEVLEEQQEQEPDARLRRSQQRLGKSIQRAARRRSRSSSAADDASPPALTGEDDARPAPEDEQGWGGAP